MQPILTLQVGGDFSYSDANNNFVWNASDNLVVLGSAFVTANDFSNKGRIDIANDFNVSAGDDFFNRGRIDVANNFDVLAGDDFYNWYGAIINAASLNVAIADRFYNLHSAEITTNSFNLVAGGLFANRYSSTINADSFNVAAGDSFYNTDSATINANDTDIFANSFVNSHTRGDGNIIADTLTLSLIGDFDYANDFGNNGNIEANNQYFTIRNGDFTNNTSIALVGNLGITADNFINTGGSITADTFALSVAGDLDYTNNFINNGNIDATALNLQVGGDFFYNDASNNFVWNTSDSLVVLGSAFITANSFINTGDITADTLNLSVAGDFDYGSDFLGNGNIDATNLNLQVGGDFSYDDANNDFVWNENNSLVVLGSAFVTTNNFTNYGDITADTLNLSVAGDFDYGSEF